MQAPSRKQWIFIAGACLLFIALYFAPREGNNKNADLSATTSKKSSIEDYIEELHKEFSEKDHNKAEEFESSLEKSSPAGTRIILDSLTGFYDRMEKPGAAAYYYEMIALKANSEKAWLNAAFRYFDGFKATQDSVFRPMLVQKAIECYTKTIEHNPGNLNAKTDLGVCYTETSQPMKGIMLLREVTEKDPNHENAQLNLGLLSMKSGQYDKAIDRFLKVIKINPSRSDIYLYLGESYVQKDDKKKAIESFEKYNSVSKNPEMVLQIQEYIKTLKS